MLKKTITAVAIAALSISQITVSYAAFPIPQEHFTTNNGTGSVLQNEQAIINRIADIKQGPNTEKITQKKGKRRGVAALLAFFFGAMGLHRFYLGYTTLGIMQAFTLPLLLVVFITMLNATTISTVGFFLLLLLVAVIIAFGFWEISDFIRILVNDLKPRTGDYVKGKRK